METSKSQMSLFATRATAKLIDFLVVYMILRYDDDEFGVIISLIYLLGADFLFSGQSIGKRIMGLRVMYPNESDGIWVGCDLKQSAIRNSIFGLILFVDLIPLFGKLFVVIGLILLLVELYFMFSDDEGIRIGDIYAKTRVYPVKVQTLNLDTQPSIKVDEAAPIEKTMEINMKGSTPKPVDKDPSPPAEKTKPSAKKD